jgi:DamX protein
MVRGKMKILNYNLSQIKTLIAEGTDLLVITSPANLGKNELSNLKNSNWRISLIRANANTNIDSLSHDIIQQALPDKAEDTLPIISQVHKYLEYSEKNGIVPVIIIEDAHELRLEILKFILQLAELRYAESLFRIVLFSDETINDRLDDPKLKDLATGVLRNIHIPSFAEEETKEHIDKHPLPSNEIDDYLFTELDIEEDTETDTSKSLYGLFIIGIGLISVFAIYLYFNTHKYEGITDPDSTIPMQSQQAISEESHSQIEFPTPQDQDLPLEENAQEQEDNNEIMGENDSIVDNHLSQTVSELDIEEDISDLQATETDEDMDTSLIELPVYIEEIEHPVVEEVEEELIPETDDENIYNLETVPEFLSGVKGPNWLRQQPAESYVLQLVSAQYMSNIKNLLSDQSDNQDQLSGYVKYTPSGKPRYLLLYGIYPNGKTAKAAINQLPIELKSTNPWPRTIGDVIKELDTVSEPSTEEDMPEGISGFG